MGDYAGNMRAICGFVKKYGHLLVGTMSQVEDLEVPYATSSRVRGWAITWVGVQGCHVLGVTQQVLRGGLIQGLLVF